MFWQAGKLPKQLPTKRPRGRPPTRNIRSQANVIHELQSAAQLTHSEVHTAAPQPQGGSADTDRPQIHKKQKATLKANASASFAEKKRKIEQAELELLSTSRETWNLKRLCRKYGVNPSALRYRIQHNATLMKMYQDSQIERTRSAQQKNRVLCDQVETVLFQHIISMAELGFACTSEDIKQLALRIATELGVRNATGKAFQASDGWLKRLKARYPGLRHRRLQDFEALRASGMNPVMVRRYFNLLQWAYFEAQKRSQSKCYSTGSTNPFGSSRIHNLDETGFDRGLTDNSWGVVSAEMRTPRRVQIGMSYHVTMVNLISADGSAKPPFFIMNGKKMPTKTEGKTTPEGRLIGVGENTAWAIQENGFLTQELWEDKVSPFICHHIRANCNPQEWHVLVLDGVSSHTMSPKAMRCFLEHKILVVKMPSHTSADLQPLDKAVFHPVKEHVRSHIRKYTLDTGQRTLDQWQLPQLLEAAWWQAATDQTIKAGFRKCGMFPLDTNWVHENSEKFMTSIPFMLYQERRDWEDNLCVSVLGPSLNGTSVTALHLIISILSPRDRLACSIASKCFQSEIKYYHARIVVDNHYEPQKAAAIVLPLGSSESSPAPTVVQQVDNTPPGELSELRPQPSQAVHDGLALQVQKAIPQAEHANTIDKSLSLMEDACVPLVQERILSEGVLLAKLTKTIADELKVSQTLAEKAIISSCELTSSVLRHFKTPISIRASLEGTFTKQLERTSKKKRTNAVGESQAEPAFLNGEKRIERLELHEAKRNEELQRKRHNKQKTCDKFLRETSVVQMLYDARIIHWNINDIEAFDSKRLLKKQDLMAFIELRQLREDVRACTGKAPSSCKRDELIAVLLEICNVPKVTTSEPSANGVDVPVVQWHQNVCEPEHAENTVSTPLGTSDLMSGSQKLT